MVKALEWNVYIENVNANRIEVYNVFKHGGFLKHCKEALSEWMYNFGFPDDMGRLAEDIRVTAQYYFWSKCEWEIILQSWPTRQDFREEKIDVYDQVRLNWDAFLDYLWENRKVLTRKKKDG